MSVHGKGFEFMPVSEACYDVALSQHLVPLDILARTVSRDPLLTAEHKEEIWAAIDERWNSNTEVDYTLPAGNLDEIIAFDQADMDAICARTDALGPLITALEAERG